MRTFYRAPAVSQICRAEFGPDYAFPTPVPGWQNMKLKSANRNGDDLRLNYHDLRTEGSWAINRKPRGEPGPDKASKEGQAVFFNGNNSTDPDGDTLSYSWSFGDGLTSPGVSAGSSGKLAQLLRASPLGSVAAIASQL